MTTSAPEEKPNTQQKRGEVSESVFAALLISPALVTVVAVLVFPLAYSTWISLHQANPFDGITDFVGLRNYVQVLTDPLFNIALKNTLYFAFVTVLGSVVLGMVMALVLNEPFRGRNFLRTIIILPWALSLIVVSIIWGWIYNGTYGALNGLLIELGLISERVGWLAYGFRAMNLVGLAYVWSVTPLAAILFLAALQSVPLELYQAAKVDGADALRRFWYITIPWMRPTLLVVLVISTLEGILAFSPILVLTGGGPGTATTVLSWLAYRISFTFLEFGKGAAAFYILAAILLVVSFIYIRFLHRR